MEDSKAMPQPGSPHTPLHAESSGSLGALSPSKSDFGASVPLPTPTALQSSSSRPSVSASTMATSLQDVAAPTFKGQPGMKSEELGDPNIMHWGTYNNPLMNPMARDTFGFNYPMQYNPGTVATYNYDQTAFNDNHNITYQCGLPASCPRSLNNTFDISGLPRTGVNVQSFPPPMYQMGPQQPYEGMDLSQSPNSNLMQLDTEYDDYPRTIPEDMAAYSTPYGSSRSSTPNEGSPLPPRDDGFFDKDRPYAQLIFDALKQAPNHTMILRDIYDWFRKNTDKALDKDTKGWQNSIRHNLSMNGVRCSRVFHTPYLHQLLLTRLLGIRESRPALRRHQKGFHVAAHGRRPRERRQVHNSLPQQATQQTRPPYRPLPPKAACWGHGRQKREEAVAPQGPHA
jgi:hypothetical protein